MKETALKSEIVKLLGETGRKGIEDLLAWMDKSGYFESPASTKYHGARAGGLAEHSYNVYQLMAKFNDECGLGLSLENITIASFGHDLCKVGAYLGEKAPYEFNRWHNKGHAKLSLAIIGKFIKLEPIEEMMIRYHMGLYGLDSFERHGEYTLDDLQIWRQYPAVKVFYFCDELATLKEKSGT